MNRDKIIKLLEERIDEMVRDILSEKKKKKSEPPKDKTPSKKEKENDNRVKKNKSYKRQYKEIQKALKRPEVNATGVMSTALDINLTKDNDERSHSFKKLNKKKTPDGEHVYKFTPDEVGKIFNALP